MNNRERIIRSLQHKESDIVPYSITLTSDACAMMASYYGDPGWIESTFAGKAGNHLSFVSRAPVPELSGWLDKDLYRDEFGQPTDVKVPTPGHVDVFKAEDQAFVDAVREGGPSPIDPDGMLLTNVIIQGVIDSDEAGGREVEVTVPTF